MQDFSLFILLIACTNDVNKITPLWFQTKTFDVYTFTGENWSEEGYTNFYPLIINNDGYDCFDYEEQSNKLQPKICKQFSSWKYYFCER